VEYRDDSEDDARLDSLATLYRLIVGFPMIEWWDKIRNRVNMALFYDRFQREVHLLGQRSLRERSRVRKELLDCVVDRGVAGPDDRTKLYWVTAKTFERWYEVSRTVGWIGILCSDFLPAMLFNPNRVSQAEFDEFLGFYASKCPWMVDRLGSQWPNAPLCLRHVGEIAELPIDGLFLRDPDRIQPTTSTSGLPVWR
jgi:hypothetical protein